VNTSDVSITVLVVDNHPLACVGVCKILETLPDIIVVGTTQDATQAQQLVANLRPRVLLLDLKMPGLRPVEFEKWVRKNFPETEVLVLTAHDCDSYLASMMDAGAKGYLTKGESENRLVSAIRRAASGESVFDAEQIARVKRWKETVFDKWENLTDRERQVLQLIGEGLDNKTIADKFVIAPKTVEYHVTNILKKLDVDTRQKAMLWMLKLSRDLITFGAS
jgi:DNA-binding NarL/FixJ family response regulator